MNYTSNHFMSIFFMGIEKYKYLQVKEKMLEINTRIHSHTGFSTISGLYIGEVES